MKLFAGNSNRQLAESVAKYLGVSVGRASVRRFADEGQVLDDVKAKVQEFLFSQFLPASQDEIVSYLNQFADSASKLGLIGFLFQYGYFIFFEVIWSGQTPGKRIVRLRVVRSNGLPIAAGEAMIRNVVRIVDSIPVGYGVGLVAMFADGQSRRLGDIAAGTLVIREQASVTLDGSISQSSYQASIQAALPPERCEDFCSSSRLLGDMVPGYRSQSKKMRIIPQRYKRPYRLGAGGDAQFQRR